MPTGSDSPRSTAGSLALAVTLAVALLAAIAPIGRAGAQTAPVSTPTAAECAAAEELVDATAAGAARFADVAVARDEGYIQATPFWFGDIPATHFASVAAARDGVALDPERPESLIYLVAADGRLVLLGVMYVAPLGSGPAIGGPLTVWHTHDELCINPEGIAPVLVSGRCPRSTVPLPAEMLHVWTVPNELGPFANLLPVADAAAASGQTADEVRPLPVVDDALLRDEVARALGLTPDEVRRRFDAGHSLAEMAEEQGIARDALLRAVDETVAAALAAATTAGELSPELQLLIQDHLTAQVRLLVDVEADAAEPAAPTTTEFGYPCLTISCLLPIDPVPAPSHDHEPGG